MSMFLRKISRKIKEGTLVDSVKIKIFSKVYLNLDFDYRKTIFIAGSGRSGTTWLSNIINHKNEYRYLFEPFYSNKVSKCKHFSFRQYLRPENSDSRFIESASDILSGKVRDPWVDRFNKRFFCRDRIIKDIRANLILKWLKSHFPEVKIIFIMRHPAAVALSRVKLNWNTDLNSFFNQQELVEDFLTPYIEEMRKARTEFEKSVFLWCIENFVALSQLSSKDYHLTFYEHLVTQPETELPKIFNFLEKDFSNSVFDILHLPSPEVRKDSALFTGESLIDKWKNSLTAQEKERMIDILSLFELDSIYGSESLPNPSGVNKFNN